MTVASFVTTAAAGLAYLAAHKKFLLSRLADACFVSSIVIIGGELGSLRIDVVNTVARSSDGLSPTLHLATCLLVVGVLSSPRRSRFTAGCRR